MQDRIEKKLATAHRTAMAMANLLAAIAEVEISNMVQKHRRRMGQRCRYAMERIEAVQ